MSLDNGNSFGVQDNTWLPDVNRDYSADKHKSPMAIHSNTPTNLVKKEKKKKKKKKGGNANEVKELMRHPENAQCADCEGKHLRAADTLWGVWLCRECAKAHTTDLPGLHNVVDVFDGELTDEQFALMKCMTNEKANKMYEAIISEKPGRKKQHCSERFIKDKYKYKFFWNQSRKDWTPAVHFAKQIQAAASSQPQQQQSATPTPSPEKRKKKRTHETKSAQLSSFAPEQQQVQQTTDLFSAFGFDSSNGSSNTQQQQPQQNNDDISDLFGLSSNNGNTAQTVSSTSSNGGGHWDAFSQLATPAPAQQQQQSSNDIMGLFSTPAPQQQGNNSFGNLLGQQQQQQTHQKKSGDIMGLFETNSNANRIDLAFSKPVMSLQQPQQQPMMGMLGQQPQQQMLGQNMMGFNQQPQQQQQNQWNGLGFT